VGTIGESVSTTMEEASHGRNARTYKTAVLTTPDGVNAAQKIN
jgi:hypothetical protein